MMKVAADILLVDKSHSVDLFLIIIITIHTFIMCLLLDKNIGAVQMSHIAAKLKLDKTVMW